MTVAELYKTVVAVRQNNDTGMRLTTLSIHTYDCAFLLLLQYCNAGYNQSNNFFPHMVPCVHGWPIIFNFIICFFYLLYHNNYDKLNESKNHPSTFVCYDWVGFCKIEFCFYFDK